MKPADLSRLFSDIIQPLLEKTTPPFPGLSGLSGSSLSWVVSLLARHRKKPLVLVVESATRAETVYRELLFFLQKAMPAPELLLFPAWEILPFEPLSPFGPLVGERIASLYRLTQMCGMGPVQAGEEAGTTSGVVITTVNAVMQRLLPAPVLARHGFTIAVGDRIDLPLFRTFLAEAGYRATSQVAEAGEFAVRGGILDFHPPGHEEAVRIELFGDNVETMRLFDPVTQRSTDDIPHIRALPVREVILNEETISRFRTNYRKHFGNAATEGEIYRQVSQGIPYPGMEQYLPFFYETTATLFDYLPEGSLFFLDPEFDALVRERHNEIMERHAHARVDQYPCVPPEQFYLQPEILPKLLGGFPVLALQHGDQPSANHLSFGFELIPEFFRGLEAETKPVMEKVAEYLHQLWSEDIRVGMVVRTIGQKERLRELLEDKKIRVRDIPDWEAMLNASPGVVYLSVGDLIDCFLHRRLRLAIITEEAIFGLRVRRRQLDQRYLDQLIAGFAELNDGDLVVHADHGIGRFGGLVTLAVGSIKNDFLVILYADDDKLYVPVENLDRVGKYSGGDHAVLDKLGSGKWEKVTQRARIRIMEMAAELVQLQAQRESGQGFAFSPPDPLYQEFAASFPFEETPDQAQAIQTVLEDMASKKPMDRLVCGDVGFGKTEVALRATFRAVMDGKQVAVLVPTTILAQQHFETFSRRLAPYPVKVALLSRFRTPAQQRVAIDDLAKGEVDVVIGTHRLLQDDIEFKDLGLLVVDEEQRFGVAHKEQIKKLRATLDILTLTATPIPRTLNLAMSGVRDISIIASPPTNRLSIRTIVTQFDRQKVREAIIREIYRGGQVFYLFNRVQDIDKAATMITELVPEAKVGVAHGQMRESRLERVMMSFYRQEFNVLVCTTIIENGVDIPSANTIIIHRADKFGLGQLHQLRGRVGRSRHRAYAYLLIPPPQTLSADAQKRLEAIENLGDLGAGFMLATHDLEIRGAGNILGDEQSGEIREVGFDLYHQMLREAITALKANPEGEQANDSPQEISTIINLHLSTYIPENYIPDVHQRLSMYKRIAQLATPDDILDMRSELQDRFGSLPDSVENLLKIVRIKGLCRIMKIVKLEAGPKGGVIHFHAEPNIEPSAILVMLQGGAGNIRFNQKNRTLSLKNRDWEETGRRLTELRQSLESLLPHNQTGRSDAGMPGVAPAPTVGDPRQFSGKPPANPAARPAGKTPAKRSG
ncbi:MAG: transcription-repair coupling factor [Magnetococcales bacterium]|nr:transcription-repair coupling factor [Magnetococcales bacterium]